ncbi:Slp family lipoprotein [Vibrio rumoiensis]|uniref:Starvation-inducible protein n=1 Tax=Vibrio rumoiensis 1S-45 TaxID=1188252 RepID=A0A1E5E1B9_9VIBR|nr:Slp family lipoprotein [Vibrio rumoiensis]OEF24048.1 hypothetical protein A1QC_02545 [Vibrio rumoiensis 1S-45]
MKRLLLIALTFLGLTACSTLPEELNAHTTDAPITNYQQWESVSSDPTKAAPEKDVRLGGIITQITNQKEKTRIEIANLPISSTGKPDINQKPEGRFVAYVDGFLDPVNYAKGRLITVVGKTLPPEKGKVGDYEYTFPVMNSYGQRLWVIQENTYISRDYYWRGGCGRGAYRCRGYGYGYGAYPVYAPVRVDTVKEVK